MITKKKLEMSEKMDLIKDLLKPKSKRRKVAGPKIKKPAILRKRKIVAEYKSILKFNKLLIVSTPTPVTSGNFIETNPHIKAA